MYWPSLLAATQWCLELLKRHNEQPIYDTDFKLKTAIWMYSLFVVFKSCVHLNGRIIPCHTHLRFKIRLRELQSTLSNSTLVFKFSYPLSALNFPTSHLSCTCMYCRKLWSYVHNITVTQVKRFVLHCFTSHHNMLHCIWKVHNTLLCEFLKRVTNILNVLVSILVDNIHLRFHLLMPKSVNLNYAIQRKVSRDMSIKWREWVNLI